uniref:Uncharacterized protein n=1 Tax=Arundo donax TaxID=35708 RepID=A0A0A9BGW7_ARUDO
MSAGTAPTRGSPPPAAAVARTHETASMSAPKLDRTPSIHDHVHTWTTSSFGGRRRVRGVG